ncbi:hypothetical protein, partial [Zoogloea sp.]|uniref:hypothetical protein n=1 Tax=Zoogloea sp. TaxID=49181 RepID=UPI0014155F7E
MNNYDATVAFETYHKRTFQFLTSNSNDYVGFIDPRILGTPQSPELEIPVPGNPPYKHLYNGYIEKRSLYDQNLLVGDIVQNGNTFRTVTNWEDQQENYKSNQHQFIIWGDTRPITATFGFAYEYLFEPGNYLEWSGPADYYGYSADGTTIQEGNSKRYYAQDYPVVISAQAPAGFQFGFWNDGSITNPYTLAATANRSIFAVYKKHLASNSTAALNGNGQKKLLRDVSGMYHAVYESAGRIFYMTNPDGGSSWTNEVYLSSAVDGTVGYSRNPAIDLYYDASALTWKPVVTWEYRTADNSGFNIAARRIQGTSWGSVEYVTQGNPVYTSNDGTPALAYPYIIYRGDDALYLSKCFSAENGVWMYGAAIPGTSSASQNPTAIYDRWKGTGLTHLSWDEDNTVYYRNMLNPADYNFQ